MFNIMRIYPKPQSLETRTKYNGDDVVRSLREMSYDKCYLCESDELQSPEIEHFSPHENNKYLDRKFSWENLFLSCSRCNGIKGNRFKELFNCCDNPDDVTKVFELIYNGRPDEDIDVNVDDAFSDNQIVLETKELLKLCYNSKNSSTQKLQRANLLENIAEHDAMLKFSRFELKKYKRMSPIDRERKVQEVKQMTEPQYPFSAFWRAFIRRDRFLQEQLGDLYDF